MTITHSSSRAPMAARASAAPSRTARPVVHVQSRRSLLTHVVSLSALSIVSALATLTYPSLSFADVTINPSDFDFPVIELPKDFVKLAHDLIDALRESIETDLSGAPEREVRRKAEPAKDLVKRFINTWGGSSAISETTACSEIRAAVQELGEFYRTKGQRAGMTSEVAKRILDHLDEAEKALPEIEEKRNFLGL